MQADYLQYSPVTFNHQSPILISINSIFTAKTLKTRCIAIQKKKKNSKIQFGFVQINK